MNVQFKKGILEICVLVLLEKQDCYGYELVQRISDKIEIAEGSMYPLLRRLTKEGYFTTYLQESSEGPSRKYYKLTDKGKDYLHEQMQEWKEFSNAVNQLIEEGVQNND
ncbi:PadR family transcriptional regulator [Virgibacillus dakarensis]|uniref:Transcriptional regulator n=1 Tax=Lentibacillus populi TaxID=1827502 RepID=A0A9W5U0A4_9BACI|nr:MULTISPECIES: PadR family transcriptional regulator [Bacillaceae]MBT2217013.1 PadR family transcriptional regulator [Virgibacillus dakarensis]MTW86922.1 PadR family transcriptional regulator [Virgibacillus dakarensis]GGB52515.1 transcriptional regulator [Lentibacillus populi]